MNKAEFRKTIEYKERIKLIKLIAGVTILMNLTFDCVGLISFFSLRELDINIATIVLVSMIFISLFITSPFIVYIFSLVRKINLIFKHLSKIYIFEYTLNFPIEHKYFQSRYLISFNFNNRNYELMTYWIYDSNNLDSKKVSIGFIENLNSIYILEKMS